MIVAIVQARMGSSRLRGKVLEDLGGRTVLAQVLERASRISGVDTVCCATPLSDENDPIAREAKRVGATVFRGSEADVLARYAGAAKMCGADVVMRITSDCPFLDWDVSAGVLARYREGGYDYVSNVAPRSWPKGLDTEVMSAAALQEAHQKATAPGDREHVTPFVLREPQFQRGVTTCAHGDFSAWRWTLDYPEDLAFCRAVAQQAAGPLPTFEEIRAIVEAAPEIAAINAGLD